MEHDYLVVRGFDLAYSLCSTPIQSAWARHAHGVALDLGYRNANALNKKRFSRHAVACRQGPEGKPYRSNAYSGMLGSNSRNLASRGGFM